MKADRFAIRQKLLIALTSLICFRWRRELPHNKRPSQTSIQNMARSSPLALEPQRWEARALRKRSPRMFRFPELP
jgi:hypothetical protein